MIPAIYTEKTQCRDCYKCVRHCPVKAIRIEGSSATVDHDLCIFCGRCVDVCPAGAKKVRDDVPRARQLLTMKDKVYVSLAPSYAAIFPDEEQDLLRDLTQLGFAGVSETAIGAEIISTEQKSVLQKGTGTCISSACPSVRMLAQRYFPEAAKRISPISSPMIAHGRFLRRLYGDDIGVVFIGPCIAKKMEADQYPETVDVALTFKEAASWIEETLGTDTAGMIHDNETDFIPFKAGKAALYPVDGGMIRSMGNSAPPNYRYFNQSGTSQIMDTLCNFAELQKEDYFLELMTCEGGCINGPGSRTNQPSITRRARLFDTWEKRDVCSTMDYLPADVLDTEWNIAGSVGTTYKQEEIEEALKALGKLTPEDRKNCGGCGYSTCEDFARAYLDGKAEKEMCVTEMRKIAQHKVSALLHTIPMGVVIVDYEMRIVECNRNFLNLFAEIPFAPDIEVLKRAEGKRLTSFLSETEPFQSLMDRGEIREKIIQINGKVMRGNFFPIQKGRLAGAVFQDITAPAVKREMVVKKAEEVIRKNLESVQQIAGLLGENAAETEIILNSLIDSFEPGEFRRSE
ncbi:[Fe-Fe] hydrogenase large subunit C-terminal domain-containing protein [Marispirochaeta sp.]|uniref:[Fe-Fe] hydrogenase large subunit C-terminal domain-containing protein n=1 Tax=Marispirochaeta sp. TaxID=2038653 RepID=UPI0029C68270|nr:[Fe-Fe] hydrogenase large subunit C-terminal domain-containing protein [Marispirochaeta sp.]